MGWIRLYSRWGGLAVAAVATGAWAAEPAAASTSGGYTWLSMLMLMLLAGGVAALAWLMRRGVGTGPAGAPGMRVIAAQALGQRERMLVVSVGSRYFLLGHTAHTLTMLSELSAEDVPQPVGRSPNTVFADLLAKLKK